MNQGTPHNSAKTVPLFAFVAVADTHVNPEDGRTSSPWRTNRLANARARAAVSRINALNPDFVIHLGDMVHPVPSQPAYAAAAERFRTLFADLRAPLHLVSGNHDVGDKPTPWMPAASINPDYLAQYRAHFGKDFYAFDHRGCRFVIVNSQILNSGLPDERVQWERLEEQLATHPRAFLFKHYPPFLYAADEDEHYDNVAEPARSRLLALLQRYSVEALFCGHVHNFFYNRIGATDCYVLPATSAVRHDYMELFPTAPTDGEHGRDARAKLGFFWIEVFPHGHVAHWIRSWGETEPVRAARRPHPRVHARAATAPLGVDLRHGWADPVSIPYTGAVDEFGRKRVRNDYLVAALWEMGLRRLRVPLQDLMEPASASRVEVLAAQGHRFSVFAFGLPEAAQRVRLARMAEHLDGIEIVERESALLTIAPAAAALRSALGIPVFLSKLRVSTETERDTARHAHFIRHGFLVGEPAVAALAAEAGLQGIDGLVFRVERDGTPWAALHAIAETLQPTTLRAVVHIRLASHDPATDMTNDADTACRVADAALAAWSVGERLSVYLDTLADHDRGYFPRHGLIDRACDPRPAGMVLRSLVELLYEVDRQSASVAADGVVRIIRTPEADLLVLLPDATHDPRALTWAGPLRFLQGPVKAVRLDTGTVVRAILRAAENGYHLEWGGPTPGIPIVISIPNGTPVVIEGPREKEIPEARR